MTYSSGSVLNRATTYSGGMSSLHLKRDIAIIVSIKVLIVLGASLFVYGPSARPYVDDISVRDRLLDNSVSLMGSLSK